MSPRYWLIDLPARLVDLWFRAYWLFLTVIAVGLFLTVMASLVLQFVFGIRWGW